MPATSPGSLASNPPPRWGAPGDDLVGDPVGRRQARDPGIVPEVLRPRETHTVSIASPAPSPFHRRPRLRAVPDLAATPETLTGSDAVAPDGALTRPGRHLRTTTDAGAAA